jgi:hypothetical protein
VAIPEGDNLSAAYPIIQDEMIATAPHTVVAANGTANPYPIYLVNHEKVWDIISKITRDHSAWTYVKPAQKTQDGRMVYKVFVPALPRSEQRRKYGDASRGQVEEHCLQWQTVSPGF